MQRSSRLLRNSRPPPAKLVKRMARGVVLAAGPGPSGWRNAAIAAIGRAEREPAVLREWIGTWTAPMVPHCTAKLWTAATVVPHDCGPKKPKPGQQMSQLPTKLPNCGGGGAREVGRELRD